MGDFWAVPPNVGSIFAIVSEHLQESTSDAWLFWDGSLGMPDAECIAHILERPGDLWHAGLRLGMGGLPELLKYVAPTWMLNCDPNSDIEAVSWRLSLRACLVRDAVLRQIGFIRKEFQTLEGASLEWGHRCIVEGVVSFHVPSLVSEDQDRAPAHLPFEDALRFVYYRYKPIWAKWSLGRSIISNPFSMLAKLNSWRKVKSANQPTRMGPYRQDVTLITEDYLRQKVTVIIPTLDRYSYLKTCIQSLLRQSVPLLEIICIDQTEGKSRIPDFYETFDPHLVRVIWQEERGQSTARNAALEQARGDWIFLADDDSEYPPDVIEQHLRLIYGCRADASSGLTLPPFEYKVPDIYQHVRVADGFATGNALVRTDLAREVGGFDRNFDFGKGADTDFGMRLYLKGALILNNPAARMVHYKAKNGGLRSYGVWWASRGIPVFQPRPAATHTYWIMRYFSPRIWPEAILYEILFGNLPSHATKTISNRQIIGHYLTELLYAPITCYQVHRSIRQAKMYHKIGPRLMGSPEP